MNLAACAILAFVQATTAQVPTADIARDLSALFSSILAASDLLKALDEVELSVGQFKTLSMLSATHDELTVKEVADVMALSLPAASRAVDGLVQRGYVERKECPSDRRSKRLALLPQGREVLSRVTAAREAALIEFAAELSDAERTALHTALLPIAERISSP
jgi:DNA-binding MarR family transcriptional regulator